MLGGKNIYINKEKNCSDVKSLVIKKKEEEKEALKITQIMLQILILESYQITYIFSLLR